ncbi:MAG: hypothetical protein JO100_07555 [Pseudonocardia sp.]|nr:hypothetical protein [Pseudonocardia sp.]
MSDPDDPVAAAAQFLVRFGGPQSLRRLLAAHVPDASGHCATCRTHTGAAPVWPCRLREIAEQMLDTPPQAGR